jgi:predicted homoserine dehydrogenase-like protein
LPHLEIPLTVSRAALFGDATVAPIGAPACDSLAIAKRNLKAGETLDGPGGFMSYALIENYQQGLREDALPMGISEGCRLTRDVPKDQAVTYKDVVLPEGRLCDKLRDEQKARFRDSAPAEAGEVERRTVAATV